MARSAITSLAGGLITVLLAAGCSDNGASPGEAENTLFPLAVGNSWVYESRFLDVVGLVHCRVVLDTVDVQYALGIACFDTLAGSLACFRFEETAEVDSLAYVTSETYYGADEDGLYCYAYRFGEWIGFGLGVTPKPAVRPAILFRGRPLAEIRSRLSSLAGGFMSHTGGDTLIFEDPPVRTLAYPLSVGTQWTYREPGSPWAIDKRVTGRESVNVPAGEYQCYAVKWMIDFGDDGEWDEDIDWVDHFSSLGLVKRSLVFRGCIIIDPDGTLVDTLDVWETTSLASYGLD